MSYNRDIKQNTEELNRQMGDMLSAFGSLSEQMLQHSDFMKQTLNIIKKSYEDEAREREAAAREAIERQKKAEEDKIAAERKAAEDKIKVEQKAAEDKIKREQELSAEIEEKQQHIRRRLDNIEELSNNAREEHNRREGRQLNKMAENLEEENIKLEQQKKLQDLKIQLMQAETDADKQKIQQEIANEQNKQELDNKRREDEKKLSDTLKAFVSIIAKVPEQIINTLVQMETKAIDSVTNVYQQHAGKLSALLDSSVQDISQMQKNIAANLRSSGLNGAISNVQVLEEASKLASSGYTNEAKLEQNATDIQIARSIAPTLDLDNRSVKNLTNVFGSDFTLKFAGIASAVQDSAGSIAAVQATLGSLMTDLEPVFLNAELQNTALQATSDVEATLSAAQEQGIIGTANVEQYKQMLVELMDPTKALTSNNVAVRQAATSLYQRSDYEAGNTAQALEELLSSTRGIMGNFSQANNTTGVIFRGFGAKAFGMDTMTAEYNPNAYTDVQMLYTGNTGQSAQEQINKLSENAYTTKQKQEENVLENSDFTQTVAGFAKEFPQLYKQMSGMTIAAINAAGSGLTHWISDRLTDKLTGGAFTGDGGVSGGPSLLSRMSQTTTLGGHQFIGSRGFGLISGNSAAGLGEAGSTLSTISGANLSGLGVVAVGANAIRGGASIYNYASKHEDQTMAQRLTYGGDIGKSMLDWGSVGTGVGMVGAAIGTLFGGPIGTAAGAAIGGLIGAIAGLGTAMYARHQAEEAQREALEAQTQATKDLLGEGIKPLTEVEKASATANGKATIAIGNDMFALADFSSSDYASVMSSNAGGLDFVPYDNYLARLHKGEAVVTAKAAEEYRQTNSQFYRDASNTRVVDKLDEQTKKIVSALNKEEIPKPVNAGAMFAQTYEIANVEI